MLNVISGGRLVTDFPVRSPMDTNDCYGQIPPTDAGHWGKAIARAERVEIAGAGDMLICERPAEVADAALGFLA